MGIRSRNYTVSDAPLRIRELFEPMSVPAAVTQFFFMMAYGVIEVYVAIYAASCHLPGGGIYFIFIALATVGTRILLGRAVDRYGEARLVYTGNAAIVAGILLLIFAHNVPCYLLSAASDVYKRQLATCCRQSCWGIVSGLSSLPCRPWRCTP